MFSLSLWGALGLESISSLVRVKNRTESGPYDGLICQLSGEKRIFKIGQNLTDLEANM